MRALAVVGPVREGKGGCGGRKKISNQEPPVERPRARSTPTPHQHVATFLLEPPTPSHSSVRGESAVPLKQITRPFIEASKAVDTIHVPTLCSPDLWRHGTFGRPHNASHLSPESYIAISLACFACVTQDSCFYRTARPAMKAPRNARKPSSLLKFAHKFAWHLCGPLSRCSVSARCA